MMKSMKKNRTHHKGEMGSWVKASGYAIKARPNPAERREDVTQDYYTRLSFLRNGFGLNLTFLHHFSYRLSVDVSHVT